jgi:hypothetical protein
LLEHLGEIVLPFTIPETLGAGIGPQYVKAKAPGYDWFRKTSSRGTSGARTISPVMFATPLNVGPSVPTTKWFKPQFASVVEITE